MADDARLSCGRSIDDVWEHLDGPPDGHERSCPYCLEARARLLRLSTAAADLRTSEAAAPELQPEPGFTASVMSLVRAEVRRAQALPLDVEEAPGLTISEQAVVGLVWVAADAVAGVRARRCQVRLVDPPDDPTDDPSDDRDAGETGHPAAEVDVTLDLVVSAGVSIPEVTDELRTRVVALVDAEAGLRVRRVHLRVEDVL